jgi:hypothetical protein
MLSDVAPATVTAEADCDHGILVGGGYDMGIAADGTTIVTKAIPDPATGTYSVTFRRIRNPDPPSPGPANVIAYAICVPL